MKEWIRSVRQGLGLAGAALLLHGCVSMSTHVPHQNYVIRSAEQRDAALLAMKSWSLQGAVSVQHASKVDVANIRWVQTPQSYRIHLASSLNAVTAELVGRGGRVVLYQGKKKPLRASSADALVLKATGWRLPVSGLRFWVRGIADPSQTSRATRDRFGHLTVLQQAGWRIQYRGFETVGGVDLPRFLVVTRPGWRIKVVIKRWQG